MIPLFIPTHFGEHYQVLAWGQVSFSSGEVVTTTDAARLFSMITRELTIPAEQWRGLLMRLNVSIPPNFFHAADIYQELVKLFQRRQLQLVKIPRLEQLPTIKAEEGWGYCFTQGPHRHPSLSYSPVAINSLQDAQAFLGQINISEKETSRLLPSTTINSKEHLAELLTNHSVLVYKTPVPTATPPVKPVEFLPATAADRPVPLGPENESPISDEAGPSKNNVTAAYMNEPSNIEPTVGDVELAKSEGSSNLHIQAREIVCRHFLESNGFSKSQIANAIGDEAAGIDGGVDLTKPVEIMSFPPPEEMTQYVNSHGFPGNWFDPTSNQTPDALGLSAEGRTLTSFKVPHSQGLLSRSKPIVDNWTNPNNPVSTAGGGHQLFVNDATKKAVISLNKVGM